jgi:ribosome-binding protein aMBF1 (putative translation factor)
MPRKPSFARYLRDARIKRGLSVAELADEVGVSGPCVYFWEMGRARPQETRI